MRMYQRRLLIQIGDRAVDALDCAFMIDRSMDYAQNTAQIQIYNLSTETRRELQERARSGLRCEILVGYGFDDAPTRLFLGNLRVVSSQRSGPDWITTIESGDGDIIKQTELTGSWASGTSLKQVAADMLAALTGAGRDLANTLLAGADDKPLDGPLAVSERGDGPLKNVLDQLGMEHSWQDGEVQIVKKYQGTGGQAVLLSPSSGMLDSPEVQGVRGFVRVPQVNVRSLLNPLIRAGSLVRIDSPAWSGTIVARRVSHTGQSWGGEWTTSVEGLVADGRT